MAKIKTSVQLFSIGLYLFALAFSFNLLIIIGDIFLIIATLITLYTGYEYTKRLQKMNIVVVSGGFDPIHSGHISYMKSAKDIGDHLIVALNSDEWLIQRKKYL